MKIDIAAVIDGYIGALLWSECCRGTAPTGDGHEHTSDDPGDCDASLKDIGYEPADLADAARRQIDSDVTDFVQANEDDLADLDPSDIGHNFLLSRNGHGTGFWDRGLGEIGDRLHAVAVPYGTMGALAGGDGKIYTHG